MEMVKYFAVVAAVVATLVVEGAEARGRRGGCPGGACYASVGTNKATASVASPAPAVVNVAPANQRAPRYVSSGWRLFGRR
jgi:hypothetical protein